MAEPSEDEHERLPGNKGLTKAEYRKSFGYRLNQRRRATGKTQLDVSKALGLERTAVSQWENNRARPHVSTLMQLAQFLGCKPEYLLEGTSDPAIAEANHSALVTVPISTVQFGADTRCFSCWSTAVYAWERYGVSVAKM